MRVLGPTMITGSDRHPVEQPERGVQTPEQFARQYELMPLRRGTSPQEIAAAMRFILSAPAMTGQMIALDGGQHLGWAQSQRTPLTE